MYELSPVTYLILNSCGEAGYFGIAALEHGEHLWEWKALLARRVPRHNAALKEPRTAVELDAIPGVGFTSFLSPALHITCRVDGGFFCLRESGKGFTLSAHMLQRGTPRYFEGSNHQSWNARNAPKLIVAMRTLKHTRFEGFSFRACHPCPGATHPHYPTSRG